MDLILFIGHHKIGSTALQAYLGRQGAALLKRGILYPAVESEGLSYMTLGPRVKLSRQARRVPFNYREGHSALAFRLLRRRELPPEHGPMPDLGSMQRTIAHQLAYTRPRAVILASEVFANIGLNRPEAIPALLEMFPDVRRVHVVATLRRIDDYLVSWYGQRMKFGTILKPLSATVPRHYKRGIHLNYRLMLEPWMKALPQAKFSVSSYDQVMANGGAVPSFLKTVGLRRLKLREPRLNVGAHRATIEFIRRANIALSKADAQRFRDVLPKIGLPASLPPSRDVEMFGADVRQHLYREFAPVDAWLSETFGHTQTGTAPTERHFFGDLDDTLVPRPVAEHACWDDLRAHFARHSLVRSDPVFDGFLSDLTLERHF